MPIPTDSLLNEPAAPRPWGRRAARWRRAGARSLVLSLAVTLALPIALAACSPAPEATEPVAAPFTWPEGGPRARLTIEGHGFVVIELYPELAPTTVENFVRLAKRGFYLGTTFHRVIPGFMIQGGDPNSKDDHPANDGQGGPGYLLDPEPSEAPHVRGVVSMANAGADHPSGSQFFIVHQDAPHLDGGQFNVFGRVVAGMDVVDAITTVEIDTYGRWGPKDRPLEKVVIGKVEIAGQQVATR